MAFNQNKIELKLSNYNDYLPINIIAYSFATSGAQGEAGGVEIISKEGKTFHFNYCEGDITENEMYLICPPLKALNEENWKLLIWEWVIDYLCIYLYMINFKKKQKS